MFINNLILKICLDLILKQLYLFRKYNILLFINVKVVKN